MTWQIQSLNVTVIYILMLTKTYTENPKKITVKISLRQVNFENVQGTQKCSIQKKTGLKIFKRYEMTGKPSASGILASHPKMKK